ncbi:Profilin family protein [Rhynchospora pubera]|uniref:Profilin family protein n=1 Tax=Rhynchospora pubera TaxID=906938 RepID=A0AAV8HKN7_9POAL|nr:Profilin family protein [Rhynchospora pubera]
MGDWAATRRVWEKWAANSVSSSGAPLKGALLLNYDPSGPSRLLPIIAEQEGTIFKAIDMQPFLDYIKRNNLQMEIFSIGRSQYMVTSIHEHWFCGHCINTSNPGGEGVIIMQIGAYLLVALYEGSLGSASEAMVAVDQFEWQLNKRSR